MELLSCAVLVLIFSIRASAEPPPADGTTLEKLGDCNWQVTYRGHIYDLSPLTRASLARPLENDIRYVLLRVPQASERLDQMNVHLHDARIYTYIASALLGGFILAKALQSHVLSNDASDGPIQARDTSRFRVFEWSTAGLALVSAGLSWRATSQSKQDLVDTVREFNAHSPYTIEPAVGGTIEPAVGGTIEPATANGPTEAPKTISNPSDTATPSETPNPGGK